MICDIVFASKGTTGSDVVKICLANWLGTVTESFLNSYTMEIKFAKSTKAIIISILF
jgi:hypothetical protein